MRAAGRARSGDRAWRASLLGVAQWRPCAAAFDPDRRRQPHRDGAGDRRQIAGRAHRRELHRYHGRRSRTSPTSIRSPIIRCRSSARKSAPRASSVYGEGKKLVGIFDVEVSYDVSRLTNELARIFPGSHMHASSVNGRIMLTRRSAGRRHARHGGDHRAPVRPGDHQFGVGDVAAAGAAGGAFRRDLRAPPAAIWACSGTASARHSIANIGNNSRRLQLRADQLGHGGWPPACSPARSRSALRIARIVSRQHSADVAHQRAGAKGRRPQPRRAEPGRAVRRHRELPRRRRISHSRSPDNSARSPSTTRNTASGSPSRRPCSAAGSST